MEEMWVGMVRDLDKVRRARGMTMGELADTSGIARPNVYRFFGLCHEPRMGTIGRIADALGVRFYYRLSQEVASVREVR